MARKGYVMKVNGETILSNVEIADNFFTRFKGLMLKKEIGEDFGLVISPCNSIHMFFMKISLDVLFVDKDNVVIGMCKGIKPWRISKMYKKGSYVVECKTGTIEKNKIKLFDKIEIV